jgi:hypothetical protein
MYAGRCVLNNRYDIAGEANDKGLIWQMQREHLAPFTNLPITSGRPEKGRKLPRGPPAMCAPVRPGGREGPDNWRNRFTKSKSSQPRTARRESIATSERASTSLLAQIEKQRNSLYELSRA